METIYDFQDLLKRAEELTGLSWIAQRKDGFYYLFNVDNSLAYECYLLVTRKDSKAELQQFLEDLVLVEKELQK